MTKPPSPTSLAQVLRHKGWPIAAASRYLGVSRQHLYNVMRNPPAGHLWQCVADGLPVFSEAIAAALPPPPKQHRVRLPRNLGFEIGDGFTCTSENDFCREGVSGFIVAIRVEKPDTRALLRMPHAEFWLTVDDLFQHYAPNGKTHAI